MHERTDAVLLGVSQEVEEPLGLNTSTFTIEPRSARLRVLKELRRTPPINLRTASLEDMAAPAIQIVDELATLSLGRIHRVGLRIESHGRRCRHRSLEEHDQSANLFCGKVEVAHL